MSAKVKYREKQNIEGEEQFNMFAEGMLQEFRKKKVNGNGNAMVADEIPSSSSQGNGNKGRSKGKGHGQGRGRKPKEPEDDEPDQESEEEKARKKGEAMIRLLNTKHTELLNQIQKIKAAPRAQLIVKEQQGMLPMIMKQSNKLSALVQGKTTEMIDATLVKAETVESGKLVQQAVSCMKEGKPHEI